MPTIVDVKHRGTQLLRRTARPPRSVRQDVPDKAVGHLLMGVVINPWYRPEQCIVVSSATSIPSAVASQIRTFAPDGEHAVHRSPPPRELANETQHAGPGRRWSAGQPEPENTTLPVMFATNTRPSTKTLMASTRPVMNVSIRARRRRAFRKPAR